MFEELGTAIASALACGLDKQAVQQEIDCYLDSDRFRKLDAETRNRQIPQIREGLKFYLKQQLLQESPMKRFISVGKVDTLINECFRGITNRLTYL